MLFSFIVVLGFFIYIIFCLIIFDIFLVLESDGCEIFNIDFFFCLKWIIDLFKIGFDLF